MSTIRNGASVNRVEEAHSSIDRSNEVRHYARDDFEFGSLLGIGALAQVVHVRDTFTEDEYALKILDKKQLRRVSQIINEKDMLFKLSHPGIVKLYFTFQDSSWLYLALELCANGELAELIARKGRLPLDLSQFYTGELVDVLTYLRKQGIAHRDIKPENLFISSTGHLKLGDFDTAKSVLSSGNAANSKETTSRMNTFVGTAQYVSPEMLHDSAIAGFGSDLWALGCVVFQMLTGFPPFRSNSEYITFQKILATEYEFPEHTPLVGKSFVSGLLVLEPQDRLGFLHIEDIARHQFLSHLEVDDLVNRDPPLAGILKLKQKRIRTTSGEDEEEDVELILSDDEGECSRLDDVEFYNLFSNQQSSNLQRAVTTSPEETENAEGQQIISIGAVAPGLKKAESSPAFLQTSNQRPRSMINLPILQEEPSLQRSSSLANEPTTPPAVLSATGLPILPSSASSAGWSKNLAPSSKPSVVVESLLSQSNDEAASLAGGSSSNDNIILRMDSQSAYSPINQPTSAAALHAYLQRICAVDEHVLMSGPVLKRRFFGRNRILVVTDLPRLLVLEPKTFRTLCEIPLLSAPSDFTRLNSSLSASSPRFSSNPLPTAATSTLLLDETQSSPVHGINGAGLAVTYLSESEFMIQTESTTWKGEVRDGTAQAWVNLIQTLTQKAVKTASTRPQRSIRPPSLAEVSARDALNRSDFGSVDVLGSVYARGYNSDLPSHAEIEAEAESRVEAAMKLMADSPENKSAAEIVAALTRQRSLPKAVSSASESAYSGDDQYRVEIDDIFTDRRRRKDSSSCSLM